MRYFIFILVFLYSVYGVDLLKKMQADPKFLENMDFLKKTYNEFMKYKYIEEIGYGFYDEKCQIGPFDIMEDKFYKDENDEKIVTGEYLDMAMSATVSSLNDLIPLKGIRSDLIYIFKNIEEEKLKKVFFSWFEASVYLYGEGPYSIRDFDKDYKCTYIQDAYIEIAKKIKKLELLKLSKRDQILQEYINYMTEGGYKKLKPEHIEQITNMCKSIIDSECLIDEEK